MFSAVCYQCLTSRQRYSYVEVCDKLGAFSVNIQSNFTLQIGKVLYMFVRSYMPDHFCKGSEPQRKLQSNVPHQKLCQYIGIDLFTDMHKNEFC